MAGRYTVLQVVGQGGMGVVMAAYDARLDRRVALKLLHAEASADDSEYHHARMLREAHAMARLSHPNVVQVYDAGTQEGMGGRIFIAMEFVEGKTLREWCKEPGRTWRQVLSAYLEAGRGLHAAHSVGLIHRDFKPDNVLVGNDARARVTDFGVARVGATPASADLPLPEDVSAGLLEPLTLPGWVPGTPRYLAPELLRGRPADARSDLFAFCLSLYEALYDQPAFPGNTPLERARNRMDGSVNPPPPRSPVPAWVAEAVLRGLSRTPVERQSSMLQLLAELEDDPDARRQARLRSAAVAVGALVLTGLAAAGWLRQEQAPGCERMEGQLAGVWDEAVRAQVQHAFSATQVPYAQESFSRVTGALDAYAKTWRQMRVAACEASPEQPGPRGLPALQVHCLERRRSQLRALTEMLSRGPDPEVLDKSVQAVRALPGLASCTDVEALTAAVPPPEDPALRARVEALMARVDQLGALFSAGKYKEGLPLGEALLSEVGTLDYAPLQAQVRYQVALLRNRNADAVGTEVLSQQVLPLAARSRDDVLAARAWVLLQDALSRKTGTDAPDLKYLTLAVDTVVERAGDARVKGDWLNNQAYDASAAGRYEEALRLYERSLALRQEALGPEHPDVVGSLRNLCSVLINLGRYEEAVDRCSRSLALAEQVLGPEHPEIARTLNNLGTVLMKMGRNAEAKAQHERALALREKALGPEHPELGASLANLGQLLQDEGRHAEALEKYERALKVRQKAWGPKDPSVARAINQVGIALRALGQYEQALGRNQQALAIMEAVRGPDSVDVAYLLESQGNTLLEMDQDAQARACFERSLAILEKKLGPDSAELAYSLAGLGEALRQLGKLEAAERHLLRARALWEKSAGTDNPALHLPLLSLGQVELARGRPAQALPLLERALRLTPATSRPNVQLALAQCLWALGAERPRALALATEARASFARMGQRRGTEEADRWLATHR
jgi:serine/threonine-protein kinase